MRAEILADEKVLLTQRNKTVGFWGSDFTVGWYGPGDIGAIDVLFLTPQNIENKKKGSWLSGTFYATNKRLIFEGEDINKNKTINLDNVDSFELLSYGIDIIEEDKSKHTFRFPEPPAIEKQLKEILNDFIIEKAERCEEVLDHDQATKLWEKIGRHDNAKRVREIVMKGQGQTFIQGDYVDDRDTIVRDSVVNKSKIGGASSKLQELKDLKELLDSGAINDKDYEQMKNEIIGNNG